MHAGAVTKHAPLTDRSETWTSTTSSIAPPPGTAADMETVQEDAVTLATEQQWQPVFQSAPSDDLLFAMGASTILQDSEQPSKGRLSVSKTLSSSWMSEQVSHASH
jgi:hypothetical protein